MRYPGILILIVLFACQKPITSDIPLTPSDTIPTPQVAVATTPYLDTLFNIPGRWFTSRQFFWDSSNRLATVLHGSGAPDVISYDSDGRVGKISYAALRMTDSIGYRADGKINVVYNTSWISPSMVNTDSFFYDTRGSLSHSIFRDFNNASRNEYQFDADSNLRTVTTFYQVYTPLEKAGSKIEFSYFDKKINPFYGLLNTSLPHRLLNVLHESNATPGSDFLQLSKNNPTRYGCYIKDAFNSWFMDTGGTLTYTYDSTGRPLTMHRFTELIYVFRYKKR